jgi:DNA-binding NarL/FixJ family response regulator
VQNKLAETKPDLVVIGLRLGTGDSLELVKAIKAQIPDSLVLVYSLLGKPSLPSERCVPAHKATS